MLSSSTHVFSEIFLHLNWHCKNDFPYLTQNIEKPLHEYIAEYCNKSKGVQFHGIGGTEDHVHLVVQIEPFVNIAEWTGKVKGASAHEMNKHERRIIVAWQRGYGVVSFAKRDLKAVLKYVDGQKEHHRNGTWNETLEKHGLMIEGEEEMAESGEYHD